MSEDVGSMFWRKAVFSKHILRPKELEVLDSCFDPRMGEMDV